MRPITKLLPLPADDDLTSLVDDFVVGVSNRIAEIEEAWARGALREVRDLSYRLHGGASAFGFRALALVAAQLTFELGHVSAAEIDARIDELATHARRASGSGTFSIRPRRPTS